MVDMVVYDVTGRHIIKAVSLGDNEIPAYLADLPEGQALAFGVGDPKMHWVWQGKIRERPMLPTITVDGCGFSVVDALPTETAIMIDGDFAQVTLTPSQDDRAWVLEAMEEATITILPPFPVQSAIIKTKNEPSSLSDAIVFDAVVIKADLQRMRAYYTTAVFEEQVALMDNLLENPSAEKKRLWQLKRAMRDRFDAGTATTYDQAAMQRAVRYSGLTVEQELARISKGAEFEDWVTLTGESLRQEVEVRLAGATSVTAIDAIIAWARQEAETAVSEAAQISPA